jgi:hypothetical protein
MHPRALAASLFFAPLFGQSIVTGPNVATQLLPVGDVDGDGQADYAFANGTTWQVASGATGAVLPYLTRTAPSAWAGYLGMAGDVNADGADDLIWQPSAQVVSGRDGTVLHTFSPSTSATGAARDFDGDGCADLIIRESVSFGSYLRIVSGSNLSVLWQVFQGSGYPPTSPSYTVGWAGDVDGDGREDFFLTWSDLMSGASGFSVHLGQGGSGPGSGTTTGITPVGDTDGDGTDEVHIAGIGIATATGVWPLTYAMPTGDVDGDGCADVMEATLFTPSSGIRSGRTHQVLPGSAGLSFRPLGDTDGDGRVEGGVWTYPGPWTWVEWVDPASPAASRLVSRGASGTTSTGRRPRIKTRGHCGLGSTVHFDVRGVMPGGLTLFAFGGAADIDLAPLGAPGNRAYTTLQAAFVIPTDVTGLARHQTTIPSSPILLGATLSVQCAAFDPAANALGLVTSNAIDLAVNN